MSELQRLEEAIANKEKLRASTSRRTRHNKDLAPPEPYRSWFEVDIAVDALRRGIDFNYEKEHIVWVEPQQLRKYKPDFFVKRKKDSRMLVVEAKGRWTADDRKKLCFVTEQNPNLDLRILFERDNRLSKSKKSRTYTEWCQRKGIKCAVGRTIPEEWMDEC